MADPTNNYVLIRGYNELNDIINSLNNRLDLIEKENTTINLNVDILKEIIDDLKTKVEYINEIRSTTSWLNVRVKLENTFNTNESIAIRGHLVEYMQNALVLPTQLTYISFPYYVIDKPTFPENLSNMFKYNLYLESIELSALKETETKHIVLDSMFEGCSNLRFISFPMLNKITIDSATNMFKLLPDDSEDVFFGYFNAYGSIMKSLSNIPDSYFHLSNIDQQTIQDSMYYSKMCRIDKNGITTFNVSETLPYSEFKAILSIVSDEIYTVDLETSLIIDYNDSKNNPRDNPLELRETLKNLYINCNNFILPDTIDYLFNECQNIETITLKNFNNPNMTSFTCVFYECKKLKTINMNEFIDNNIENLASTFYDCNSLEDINIPCLMSDSLKSMEWTFGYCLSLKQLDFSNCKGNNLITMNYIFAYCRALQSVNLDDFEGEQLSNFYHCFYDCSFPLSMPKFKGNSLNNFCMCSSWSGNYMGTSINLPLLEAKNDYNLEYMFSGCKKVKILDLPNLVGYDNTKSTQHIWASGMFFNCEEVERINCPKLLISTKDDYVSCIYLFQNCYKLKEINMPSFVGRGISDFTYWFYKCYELETISFPNLTSDLTKSCSADNTFDYCNSLKYINLPKYNSLHYTIPFNWAIREVIKLGANIEEFSIPAYTGTNVNSISYVFDIYGPKRLIASSFNPTNPTDWKGDPINCNAGNFLYNNTYTEYIDFSSFNGKIDNTYRMFCKASKLNTLIINKFVGNEITDAGYMFSECISLAQLDLNMFEGQNIEKTNCMFKGSYLLEELDLRSLSTNITTNADNFTEMFLFTCPPDSNNAYIDIYLSGKFIINNILDTEKSNIIKLINESTVTFQNDKIYKLHCRKTNDNTIIESALVQ